MGFWENETCEHCGGTISEHCITLHRRVKGKDILLENVPAGICSECGTRYFTANVLKTIKESVRARRQAEREILVPVYAL